MPPRGKLVDDSEWIEVYFANDYSLLIGYLSMAVKGLGFLVLTWTTVVLLGGFVSTLQRKDFWCLTFITLAQTAGIFDVLLTEKLSYIGDSIGAIYAIRSAVFEDQPLQRKRQVLANVVATVHQVVFVILLFPLAAVYMFGLIISAGISVWRLIQHDYGNGSDADGLGNLKPALDILYSIALLQGVIFCYKGLFSYAKGSVVNAVLKREQFGDQVRVGISDYLLETTIGCEKNPSFARGRNLITYAVDLMGSKSPDDYVSGVRILDAFARQMQIVAKKLDEENLIYGRRTLKCFMQEHILMKHLIMSASPTDLVKKLLQTLGSRSIYDRETRACAARIVAYIAASIVLEEFPTGILYISSLINSFETYSLLQPYQRDWARETFEQNWHPVALHLRSPDRDDNEDQREDSDGELLNAYKELMVQGFRILCKLATNDDNCRILLDTPCLLEKIMAPVTSDLLHQIDHGAWHSIVEGSLKVIIYLVATSGQTGTKLRSKICSSKEAISTMERILECDKCDQKLQRDVIRVFGHLYMDTSLILENADREKFIEMLLADIMTDDNKDKEYRRWAAAHTLRALCSKTETGARSIIMANDNVVNSLAIMTVGKGRFRLYAAEILKSLCIHHANDDASLKTLKRVMRDVVPKVLEEIVCWASVETRAVIEGDQVRSTEPETDLENQSGVPQDNCQGNNTSSSNQQDHKMTEYEVNFMLSLCVTICDTLISADQDLTPQFESTTATDGVSSFPMKLKQIVRKSMHSTPDCLAILKFTCKMVITMMKHSGRYVKEDLESLMDTLSTASKDMALLDGSMVFDFEEDGGDATTPEPFRSLASLVKEAQELVEKRIEL